MVRYFIKYHDFQNENNVIILRRLEIAKKDISQRYKFHVLLTIGFWQDTRRRKTEGAQIPDNYPNVC